MSSVTAAVLVCSFTLVNCIFPLSLFPQDLTNGQNYKFTEWSGFGECSKVCGGGRRARTRSCVNATRHHVILEKCYDQLPIGSYDLFTIIKYGSKYFEEDEEICNKIECETSSWQLASECTRKCGGGTWTYHRTCLNSVDQDKCNFQSTQLFPCNTHACFVLQEWQGWTPCSKFCGVGYTVRKRECMPNASPENSMNYQKLLNLIRKFNEIPINFTSQDDIYYFSLYLSTCKRFRQKRLCNDKQCPTCPNNQVYHSCLPCTKHCSKLSFNDLKNWKFDLMEALKNTGACHGKCEHGCGCPVFTPYLGSDGVCYQFPMLCPANHLTPQQESHIVWRLLLGNTPRRTTASAGQRAHVATTKSTTASTIAGRTTTTTTTTTTTPTTTGNVTSANTESSKTTKPDCPKDIPILQHDYCHCTGVSKNVPCVANSGQKCPIICKDVPTCPDKLSPRMKNAQECMLPECESDNQCPEEGTLCCELLCGRRCMRGL